MRSYAVNNQRQFFFFGNKNVVFERLRLTLLTDLRVLEPIKAGFTDGYMAQLWMNVCQPALRTVKACLKL